MAETCLITLSDIQEFKAISENINTFSDLVPFILEAQDFELRPFLGDGMYRDLINDFNDSPSLSVFGDLFNGQVFQIAGIDYEHKGLKSILVYHSYARYAANANIKSTASGFMHKTSQYSEKADLATISRIIKEARTGATSHEDRVRRYLQHNFNEFPKWIHGKKSTNYKSGMKFRPIG